MSSVTIPNKYMLKEYAKDSWYNTKHIFAPVFGAFVCAVAVGTFMESLEHQEQTAVVREASLRTTNRIGVVLRDFYTDNAQIAEVKVGSTSRWLKVECDDGSLVQTIETSPYLLSAPFSPPDVISPDRAECDDDRITAEDHLFPVGAAVTLS